MADKKIIAVIGSTGTQGGGLARAILADPNGGFAVRAITRDPNKDNAKALAAKGAEVVSANLDDVESLKRRSPVRTASTPSRTSGSTSPLKRRRCRPGTSPMRPKRLA